MTLFPYTDKNHFQYGYRDLRSRETRWLEPRLRDDEEFVARYGRARSRFQSWREANREAASRILEIANEKNLVPTILSGGGIDSEIVLVAFLEALEKIETAQRPRVDVVSYALSNGGNRHDLEYIAKFREHSKFSGKLSEFDIQFKTHEIDAEAYLESAEFLALADETKIVSPVVICQLHLCEKIFAAEPRALPIIGQGEIHLVREEDLSGAYAPRPWSIVETENLCGLYRFFIGRSLPAIPGFFQFLPEQFESQLRLNPVLHDLISNSRSGKLGTRSSKTEVLAHDYPELETRPKYTGFEKLPELHDRWRATLGARFASSEGKWRLGVWDLARRIRVAKPGIAEAGDWKFAWKKDGDETRSTRGSADDVFATEWMATPSASSFQDAITRYVNSIGDIKLLHDGSLLARAIHRLRPSATHLAPKFSDDAPSLPAKIAKLTLDSQVFDPENLAFLLWKETLRDDVIIPRVHSRIVNAEFDRDLSATLTKPRFAALESEGLALLSQALHASSTTIAQPWSSHTLTQSLIDETESSGWPTLDEPGISNHEPWLKYLEVLLTKLGETAAEKEFGQKAARDFQDYTKKIETALSQCALPESRYLMTSRRVFDKASKASLKNQGPFPSLANSFANHAKLRVVSTARWLHQAQLRVPDLTYGANLFYQHRLEGFVKFDENLRTSLALIQDGEEVAWAHLTAITVPPHGRLRIRGVTVRRDLDKKGFATTLIKEIAQTLKANRPAGFSAIDVYAAPEALKAFRSAGFRDDLSRVTRAEEALDPATGRLIALDRELTPLTFSLGDA